MALFNKKMCTLSAGLALFILSLSISCGGGGGGGGGKVDPATAQINGMEAFVDQDITEAEKQYCNGLHDNAADSRLAFGCALSRLLQLTESATVTSLLEDLGESAIDLDNDLLADGAFFDQSEFIAVNRYWPKFNYTGFNLPFASVFAVGGLSTEIATILRAAIANGVTADDIKNKVADLIGDFEEIESNLDVVLADTSFTYTIPKELFHTGQDVDVSYNDARLFMAAVKGQLVGINILDAYDIGVDISKIIRNGAIDQEILVADLNGSGETVHGIRVDTTQFLSLNGAKPVRQQKARFTGALNYLNLGLQRLRAGETSDFYTDTIKRYDLDRGLEFVAEMIASMSGMTPIQSLDLKTKAVSLNLGEFFDNPPDADRVDNSAGDPFVVEEEPPGSFHFIARPVELYFKTFFTDIATF